MLKNYLKLAFRNTLKSKSTSLINIAGISIGFTCVLLIYSYISYDLSFDQFHSKKENIYRVLTIDEALGVTSNLVGITLPPLALTMEEEFPEVVNSVRINSSGRNLLEYNQIPLYSENLMYTENSIFEIFDLNLTKGNKETVLKAPNTAVLTQSMARKIFKEEDPIGKTITLDNSTEISVVGVMDDVTKKSHILYDVLISMVPAEQDSATRQFLSSWGSIAMTSYVEFAPDTDSELVKAKMEQLIRSHDVGENFNVTLQPLTDVHLESSGILFDIVNHEKSDINYVRTLGTVGLFVLLIGAFNFMNLSSARSANRAKEVGVRKVMGAFRHQLIFQFITESILICVISFFLAILIVGFIGIYADLGIGQNPAMYFLENPLNIVISIGIVLIIGLAAGVYPALILSGFKSIIVLRGNFKTSASGVWLRRVLVVVQFGVSIAMIIGSFVVFNQLDYIKNTSKGFNEDQIITVNLGDETLINNAEKLMDELSEHPGILRTATSGTMPGRGVGRTRVFPQGSTNDEVWILSIMSMDENFISLMGMDMAWGRAYSEQIASDEEQSVIINEAAAREFGWDDYEDKTIGFGPEGVNKRNVIGVVEDFHFTNMRHQIEPMVIMFNPGGNGVLSIKVEANNIKSSLAHLEKKWNEINPAHPLEYSFFDEEFGQLYENDEKFAQLVIAFTWLAIFVAVLGLFGLSIFTAEQKVHEIGVRKVLGATIGNIIFLLSKEFLLLIGFSCLIAFPVAWYFMSSWLEEFAYRIDLGWQFFVLAALVSLILGQLTVSYQSLKAALVNPVSALKHE